MYSFQQPVFRPSKILFSLCFMFLFFSSFTQNTWDTLIEQELKSTILLHKELLSIPNLPKDEAKMQENIAWVSERLAAYGFKNQLLASSTLPLLLSEKMIDPALPTVLFYIHIDGQPVNPKTWDQNDPFEPILKKRSPSGTWESIDWSNLAEGINDEWRIFARSASDDKAPIAMMLTALKIMNTQNKAPKFNIKIVFDPEEEYGSRAFLTTLDEYLPQYAADYFIVMDGPAHNSNKPTVTFGCRGLAFCIITTYGPKLPQHSGHYGNYTPNPVFRLANLLSSMKDESGRVLIKGYYHGIEIDTATQKILESVPYDPEKLHKALGIEQAEKVGTSYQAALQYPSLNVRQIGTSWKGEKSKTIVPEIAMADIDVRLVPETDGAEQLEKIRQHLVHQGYHVLDRDPTDEERRQYDKIVKFMPFPLVNAFRTDPDSEFGQKIRTSLTNDFEEAPIVLRMMGGTLPIVPMINKLNIPTLIIPMVNMDNNQHNPNENIRIGNIRQGIKTCLSILQTSL